MAPIVRKVVGIWLLTGCLMIFLQVLLGGVTRLTDSGLSITEWKPIVGVVPPLNELAWNAKFDLYKQKVQYKTINQGMTPDEFKWIFFWEYLHRFWGMFMGIVFIVPFSFFVLKGWLNKDFFKKLSVVFIWGGVIGLYGWIMVRSGLTGVFVPPVNLSIHLVLALSLFAYLNWMALYVLRGKQTFGNFKPVLKKLAIAILVLLFCQLFFGGITSGMKAGLAYPTWPDMNGQIIPDALFTQKASLTGFLTYNAQDLWGRTAIQFVHRFTAYVLIILVFIFFFKSRNITTDKIFKTGLNLFPVFVLLQATIGIITVINCIGKIPVGLGALHQAGAMLLTAEVVFIVFHLTYRTETGNV